MKNRTMILRVHVAGESTVGKTSLLTRIVQDRFEHGYRYMIGVDVFTQNYHIREQMVKVRYMDDAGTQRFFKLRSPGLRNSQVILLCFSLNDPQSFESIFCWLDHIRQINQDCTLYLVGCKSDLEQTVRQESILRFARQQGIQYFKCSAKDNIGIGHNFDGIVNTVATRIINDPEKIGETALLPQAPPSRSQPSLSSCRA